MCALPETSSQSPPQRRDLFLLPAILLYGWLSSQSVLAEDPVFETEARRVLKTWCWHCHGEDAEFKGGLDARFARQLQKGGDSGPAIVPHDPAGSLLIQRITSGEMPPGEKKVPPQDLQVLQQWIAAGAKVRASEPELAAPGLLLSDEDRSHWAFQPIIRPPVPFAGQPNAPANPIDAFLLQRLQQQGLQFAAAADRETLLRRLSLDLHGLPPGTAAIDQFTADQSPEAWSTVVEQLLAAPAYGERWARHWLDVAGYADSDGYTEKDPERPWAWKYRDYVIRSLNADKPWNQFLVEQLAGDELVAPPWENLTPEQADALTATGFLRMAPDGTADGSVDQPTARNEVVAETLKTVSTALLGLSVGCAQCHDHRYDPISQVDYYRLRAIFEPAWNLAEWRAPGGRIISMWSAETRAVAAAVDQELAETAKKRTEELDGIVHETFERELQKLPAERQTLARAARETAKEKRTEEQQQLIREFPFLNVDRGSVYLYLPDRLTGFNKKWDDLTAEVKKKRPADDYVMCLTELPGRVPPTHLFARGDHQQPRQPVAPGGLSVLEQAEAVIPEDDPELPTSGRRLAWARSLTSGRHPLVARVLMNRVWMLHFGQGLVATAGEFGLQGERPSHPELLDWMASEFMESGWSLKHMHRLILSTQAWRQISVRRSEHDAVDPDNRLLGRMNLRRLEAETIRDCILAVSGQLNGKMAGPPAPVSPDDVGQYVIAIDTRDSAGRPTGKVEALHGEDLRRSIYVQVRRSMPLGVLEPFDLPRMTPNCERRAVSTTSSQALLMLNNPFVLQQAGKLAERLRAGSQDQAEQINVAWRLVFGRRPTSADVAGAVEFLAAGATTAGTAAGGVADEKPAVEAGAAVDPLQLWCHALLCSSGFLYAE